MNKEYEFWLLPEHTLTSVQRLQVELAKSLGSRVYEHKIMMARLAAKLYQVSEYRGRNG